MSPDLFSRLSAGARAYYRAVHADGVTVERLDLDHVVACVKTYLTSSDVEPLALLSVNVDHLHHFAPGRSRIDGNDEAKIRWLALADGAPVAARAGRAVREPWPRVTGADLLPELLSAAESVHATVGFLGGTPQSHSALREVLARDYPRLQRAHYWSPERSQVDDPAGARALATEVRKAQVDMLCVAFGKPRQEEWIQQYGAASGCKVLLAFGASADFLAGQSARAPEWARTSGLEWLYRLSREPGRLAKRYLVQGPVAALRLISARDVTPLEASPSATAHADSPAPRHPRRTGLETRRTQQQHPHDRAEK